MDLLFVMEIEWALLGDDGGRHNPLIRPAISWGGWHWVGAPLDFHDFWWFFFNFYHGIHHHFPPPFGRIFLELLSKHQWSRSKYIYQLIYHENQPFMVWTFQMLGKPLQVGPKKKALASQSKPAGRYLLPKWTAPVPWHRSVWPVSTGLPGFSMSTYEVKWGPYKLDEITPVIHLFSSIYGGYNSICNNNNPQKNGRK